MRKIFAIIILLSAIKSNAQTQNFVEKNYDKVQTYITARDGIKLYTIIYVPKDASAQNTYPFLMERTPYSIAPYAYNEYPSRIGPNEQLMREKYIFVYQDVRGRYMSEGINLEVTPYIANKKSNKDVDESSDTYDTIEWLLKNIKFNNGKVGIWGISYPGFYATTSLPGAHPALKAVSPQAPVTDEFIGDDANHNGAFFLMDNFFFMRSFGKPRQEPVVSYRGPFFSAKVEDAYDFFLKLGPLSNTQSEKYFNHKSYIWNEYLQHDTYDSYWRARNIRRHLKNINIPTLVVGGWFDAEDLFGALNTYKAIEKLSPRNQAKLVMGPWTHGAWAVDSWEKLGINSFGANTNVFYRNILENPFFNYYLKGVGNFNLSEATIFVTGLNQWKLYNTWPLKTTKPTPFYLSAEKKLLPQLQSGSSFDEYISDPANPVPYTEGKRGGRNNLYMTEDQRFLSDRSDVVSYTGAVLEKDLLLAGPITADLNVSITGTDADFIVKLIDVWPNDTADVKLNGYQQLIRAEVIRGKFRKSFEKPKPFVPGKKTKVKFALNDVAHQFKKGHRLMVQVQSSWFPLVDRNPQSFLKIPEAKESDFQRAKIRIYHSSKILLPVEIN